MSDLYAGAIADRVASLDASGIRKVFDLAAKMKDPINLSIGQPDFDVPESVKAAAIDAINKGHNRYTQTQGIPELRAAIAESLEKEFGWKPGERPLLVTMGVSGALMLAFQVLVNPGDEVIMCDPYFVIYKHLCTITGGKAVFLDTYPTFRPNPQQIADAITPRTKMLILNSPANPTGVVYTREELEEIAAVCRKHNLLVISDEIYDMFCYDEPFVSMASVYENTLLMRGFSKSYAMTGWRMAYVTGPTTVMEKMTVLQQYTFVCAPSMAQYAAIAALKVDLTQKNREYAHKRDICQEMLGEKFGLLKPGGAFYAFVPAPKGMTGTDFAVKAVDKNVLVIPGCVFSEKDSHFRISYATTDERLRQGLELLSTLV